MIVLERDLPDGRSVMVCLMLFTYRICLCEGALVLDGWCYPMDLGSRFVVAAARAWDGNGDPPDGWIKHINSGRRRENGDPAREYVER